MEIAEHFASLVNYFDYFDQHFQKWSIIKVIGHFENEILSFKDHLNF